MGGALHDDRPLFRRLLGSHPLPLLPGGDLLEVLGGTVVLSPSQKSKLENVLKDAYPATFPLRLMLKDFGLILDTAMHSGTPMPMTAAAQQVCVAEFAKQSAVGREEDFSSVVRTMEQMAQV